MTAGVNFSINPSVWRQLKADADAFDKGIIRGLRKRIRMITADGVDAVKKAVEQDTPGGAPDFPDSARKAIAASLRTQILFGTRTSGVRIRVDSSALPEEHKAIVAAYNKRQFRHPVYGGEGWVQQEGRPYFGAVLLEQRERMQVEIMEAVSDGLRAMGARNA